MHRSQLVIVLVLATFAGCVSRQCPEGKKFDQGACTDEAAADAGADAEVAPIDDVPSATSVVIADAGSSRVMPDAGAHAHADAAVLPVMPVVPVVPMDAGRSDAQAPSHAPSQAPSIDSGPACAFTGRETCNGKDDDCDGEVDEEDADDTCSAPHSSATCASGKCGRRYCEVGFGACNAVDTDGCEQALNAPDNCGECGVTCDALATCAPTQVEGVGDCTCNAPAFGDGSTCQGPAPIAAGVRWTCGIDPDHHAVCTAKKTRRYLEATRQDPIQTARARQRAGPRLRRHTDDRLDCWNGPFSTAAPSVVQVVAGDNLRCAA